MVVGPLGCGKTTLISIITTILGHGAGQCRVLGRDLEGMDERERAYFRRKFQLFNLLPALTAAEFASCADCGRKCRCSLALVVAIGFLAAAAAVILGNEAPPVSPAPLPSAHVPYESCVAGTGPIEASTGNIAIGTPVSGIVDAIFVKWGDRISKGEPLFKLEARDLSAQLEVANAKIAEAEASLAKTQNLLKVGERLQRTVKEGRAKPHVSSCTI